jgi:hypothetical protein
MPTEKQAKQTVILLHWISTYFQPINIVRYDRKFKTVYIQAGEADSIALMIDSLGRWEFV